MNFIVDKKPRYIEECPFYDNGTEQCHAGGYEEDPECWDGWEETFNEDDCPYFVELRAVLPIVCLIKDSDEND